MKRSLLFIILLVFIAGCGSKCNPDDKDDLYYLCKVWGFLKYYHPAVASGEYDWDQELFTILVGLDSIDTPAQRNMLFLKWVDGLGSVESDERNRSLPDKIYKQTPDFDWINFGSLGKELCLKLTHIRYCRPPKSNHYVSFYPDEGYPVVFENEKAYPDVKPWEDVNYRILTLFRLWNVVEYLYPYKYLTDKLWESVLTEYIPLFVGVDTRHEFVKLLYRFTAEMCDSHVFLYNPQYIDFYELFGIGAPIKVMPYGIEYIEDKYIVTKVLGEEHLRVGDILVEINGMNIDSLATVMRPYVATSNESRYHATICQHFLETYQDSMKQVVERNGELIGLTLASIGWEEYKRRLNVYYEGRTIMTIDNIGYINLGNFLISDISATMELMSDKKGLILDLRAYPKEPVLYELRSYLVKGDEPFFKYSCTSFDHIGYFKCSTETPPEKQVVEFFFDKKIIILVDAGTMSQGEFTAMSWGMASNAVIIGSQTAGADGNTSTLVLPGDYRLTFTGLGIYYPDGGETQRVGIRIDEEVRPTIQGIREGRDELLERALMILGSVVQ